MSSLWEDWTLGVGLSQEEGGGRQEAGDEGEQGQDDRQEGQEETGEVQGW